MSEADKMFEELDYRMYTGENFIWYKKKLQENIIKDIIFSIEDKEIACETDYFDKRGNLLKRDGEFTIEELQAINKKCEEMGWIDE